MQHNAAHVLNPIQTMPIKNRVTTNLDDEKYKDLVFLSEKLDVSLSWLGRKAFSDLLENYKNSDSSDLIINSLKEEKI